MMRVFALIAAVLWAAPVAAQTVYADDQVVRMTTAEFAEKPDTLARTLEKILPAENAPVSIGAGAYAVNYAGVKPPRRFVNFLKTRFPEVAEGAFGPGVPTNVSLVISEIDEGSSAQLVMLVPKTRAMQAESESFHAELFGQELPASARIYVNTAPREGNPGNIVLSLGKNREEATAQYVTWLEDEGFDVQRSDERDNNLILAERDQLVAYLFFQDDPDRAGGSIMVLQHMEE